MEERNCMAPLRVILVLTLCGGVRSCVFCSLKYKNVENRFHQLCSGYMKTYNKTRCSKYMENTDFDDFAFHENKVIQITEKTHRVFRVLEINRSLADLPQYWDWLFEKKLVEYTHQVLCPPTCRGFVRTVNCTTCQREKVDCWDFKRCYPEKLSLQESVYLLIIISVACFAIGTFSFFSEYYFIYRHEK
ncbi:sperm-egg fusion protein TMEM95 [Latimeria chalumnae]|uniref:Transmembrane protein 95 n=1 Tax=Latimeria chalumnae TaxID=7897 RepID=M3XHZ1_LATCH|nr:PREDICTED: transmembrane protein 95 isoform X1 [Latimeria chalumnae]|eukprot:XP_014345104.1 PREDICTED: transmembrane protein 95 isoform X1 [Latimeria chalumnae]